MTLPLRVDAHPLLDLGAFACTLPTPLSELPSPPWLCALLDAGAPAPLTRGEEVRQEVRNLLRHGGYKPTGRGKPASEYLVKASVEGPLRSINALVDACNVVSLHSGLPISIVDLDLAQPPLSIGLASAEASYVFNPSGQEIRLGGLLCLHDAQGPCANGVKDSQRTKTHDGTRRALTVVWGSQALGDRAARATAWYRELVSRLGAELEDLTLNS